MTWSPFCLVLRVLKYLTYNTHTGFKTFSPHKNSREKFSQDLSSRYSWYQMPPQAGLLSVGQRSCQEARPFPLHIWSEAKSVVFQLLERPLRVRWMQQWPHVTIMACRVEEKRCKWPRSYLWKLETSFSKAKQETVQLNLCLGGRES